MKKKRFSKKFIEQRYQKAHNWEESCTAHIGLKVPPSMKEALREIDNWNEKLRQAIAQMIEQEKGSSQYEEPKNNKSLRTGKDSSSYEVDQNATN